MKTKQHFIITIYERKFSRNHGGSRYTLALHEVVNKGELKYIGLSKEHSTGSHRGEISEGYNDLKTFDAINAAVLKKIDKAQKASAEYSGNYNSYYYDSFNEKFGLKITLL